MITSLALLLLAASAPVTFETSRFGTVTLVRPDHDGSPANVALFASGDGGWNQGVVDMAKRIAEQHDTLVVGFSTPRYLARAGSGSATCAYPAGDLEELGQDAQKRLALPTYRAPILVGYSSGATLVYAALAEAPPGTFRGALSLGFDGELAIAKPLCHGHGLATATGPRAGANVAVLPSKRLETPWIVLQGEIDQVANADATAAFVTKVSGAEIVRLPSVGHGFSVGRNWQNAFDVSYVKLAAARTPSDVPEVRPALGPRSVSTGSTDVSDLPLVEVPAVSGSANSLAVVLSGDGGWVGIDKAVADEFAAHGVPTVGIDALQYFWNAKTEAVASADLSRVIRHYLAAWGKERVILVGYSRGADTLPFMASRLPDDLSQTVEVVALLGPATETKLEFHVVDWLRNASGVGMLKVVPEIEKLTKHEVLCFYGSDETDSACRGLPDETATVVEMAGGHHFDGSYAEIATRILRVGH